MDFLIFALWGVITGAIICGGSLKKSSNEIVETQPAHEIVSTVVEEKASPVVASALAVTPIKTATSSVVETPVATIQNKTAASASTETSAASPLDVLELSPEEAVKAETYSAESFDLPEGLALDQIMLDAEGNPLIHKVQKGEFLTQMARKYYGDYRFWPYILDVNRHLFDSPEKVQADMEIFLPNATTYDINPDSSESIDKAKSLMVKLMQ